MIIITIFITIISILIIMIISVASQGHERDDADARWHGGRQGRHSGISRARILIIKVILLIVMCLTII